MNHYTHPTGRTSSLVWLQRTEVRKFHVECQEHLYEHPGTKGPGGAHEYNSRKGDYETLWQLWEHRNSVEKIAAILICASTFSRIHSRRGRNYLRDYWPSTFCVRALEKWAFEAWLGEDDAQIWHSLSSNVLPISSDDYDYKIESLPALVRYLAEEHAALLCQYTPVVVEYVAKPDKFIAGIVKSRKEERDKEWADWKLRQEEATESRELERKKMLEIHPRWGEWNNLSSQELEKLVWSMPTSQVAKLFGVSDVAVGKRCRSERIRKPPLGFWRKVETGKLPHPQGKPVNG